jgi:hypothetical protein
MPFAIGMAISHASRGALAAANADRLLGYVIEMYGSPAVPPVRTWLQVGPFPAASGSFAWNARNGGMSVVGLCFFDYSTKAGTAGISTTQRSGLASGFVTPCSLSITTGPAAS